MRISQFQEFYYKALLLKKRVMVVGPPGTGKSYSIAQVCQKAAYDLITICAPLQNPTKVGGYPIRPEKPGEMASHALFDGIALAFAATKPTVLLWDDLGMAGGETLKSILDLVQFGRIDGKMLPEHVVIAAATNDVGHGADVQGMIEPLKNRWHTIVHVENCVDDIVLFGLANGWPSDLLAYLRNDESALNDWKPCKSMNNDGATPRGWEYVSEWINAGIDDPEVIAGCVGKGRATAYLAFRQLVNELPDVAQVLMSPDTAPVPENPSARLLVSMALATKMDGNNFGKALTYLKRLPAMMRAYGIRDAVRAEGAKRSAGKLPKGHSAISMSRDWTAWACSQDGKDIMGVGQP